MINHDVSVYRLAKGYVPKIASKKIRQKVDDYSMNENRKMYFPYCEFLKLICLMCFALFKHEISFFNEIVARRFLIDFNIDKI